MGPRIAVNTRFLISGKLEGIGHFTVETLKRIVRGNPGVQFYFLFDRPFSEEFMFDRNVVPVVLPPPARHPVLWWIWFEQSVTTWLRSHGPDLFLSPDGFGCLGSGMPPQVPVIHDLAFEHYPEHVPWAVRSYYRHFVRKYARRAARVVTVSDYTKSDIVARYQVDPSRIDVVYNGSSTQYKPADREVARAVKCRYTEGYDFFLYVGSIHPRKNLPRLLRAFDLYRRFGHTDIKLVIVGAKAWGNSDLERTLASMKYRSEVVFTGYLADEELQHLLPAARALVYVSLFEGFGIPIVEAWSAGVPVITSNVSSMAEIGRDAALLVDPLDVPAIARAMATVISDSQLSAELVRRGTARGDTFGWQATADKLWASVQMVLRSARQEPSIPGGTGHGRG